MSGNFYEGLLSGNHTSEVRPTADEHFISAPLTTHRLLHHNRRRNATAEPVATRDIRGWGGGVGAKGTRSKKRLQSAAKLGGESKDTQVPRQRQHQAYEPKRSIKASITITSGRLTTSRQRRKTSSALVSRDGDSPGGFLPIGARSAASKSGSAGDNQGLSVPEARTPSSVRTTPLLHLLQSSSRLKRQQSVADEQSEFDKDVAIAEQKLANFEPEIPQRKPGRTDCDDARRAIMQLYHERQRQARKVDPIPIPKSPRKLERTHHRGPTPPGSTFGRIEYCSAVQLKGTPRAIKQSRPQRFADLTKLCSATANYDMWASAAEPSNSEDSKWTFEELLG